MPNPFSSVALTARLDFPDKEKVLADIVNVVQETGASVHVDAKRCAVSPLRAHRQFENIPDVDLIIVAGGDGTIIATVREMANLKTPIIGIHYGSLGFLTSINATEVDQELPKLLKGEGVIDERQLLSISIEENGSLRNVGRVLNEAVISQGVISRILHLRTTVENEELTTFRADGLILATPTGSTAYSLAAGGSIVHPNALGHQTILTPINPHSFFQKPIIIPGASDVVIEVATKHNAYHETHPVLTLDGQVTHPIRRNQKIHACAHEEHAKFIRKSNDSFYQRIREKLRWGE